MGLHRQKNRYRLEFASSDARPFAYLPDGPVGVARFKQDVLALTACMQAAPPGDVLLTAVGRYSFSVALLAAWLAQKVVILPPDQHQQTRQKIRDAHQIAYECDRAWESSLAEARRTTPEPGLRQWSLELSSDTTAVRIYTSGSSGKPVGVDKSIDNLFREALALAQQFNWPDRPVVGTVSSQHLYGLSFTVLLPWCRDTPLVDETPVFPADVERVLSDTRAGVLVSVPAHYKALIENGFQPQGLFCVSAAAPLETGLAGRWAALNGQAIHEIYGSTETGVIASRNATGVSRWQLLTEVEIKIKSARLFVMSPYVAQAWPQGFQTEDKVQLFEDGQFALLGRADRLIKICGKRVSLVEVEAALLDCEAVEDAATLAVRLDQQLRDQVIWAAVVSNRAITAREIRQVLRDKLDDISIPRRIVFVEQLPRNENGKLTRKTLETLFETAPATDASDV